MKKSRLVYNWASNMRCESAPRAATRVAFDVDRDWARTSAAVGILWVGMRKRERERERVRCCVYMSIQDSLPVKSLQKPGDVELTQYLRQGFKDWRNREETTNKNCKIFWNIHHLQQDPSSPQLPSDISTLILDLEKIFGILLRKVHWLELASTNPSQVTDESFQYTMRDIEILDPRNFVKNREILYRLMIRYNPLLTVFLLVWCTFHSIGTLASLG